MAEFAIINITTATAAAKAITSVTFMATAVTAKANISVTFMVTAVTFMVNTAVLAVLFTIGPQLLTILARWGHCSTVVRAGKAHK
jgi:hypothetical protein